MVVSGLLLVGGSMAWQVHGCGDGEISGEPPPRGCSSTDDCLDGESCQAGLCLTLAPPECGNGLLETDEECDLGTANADTGYCTSACELAVCGDGHHWAEEEECDDGNSWEGDACKPDCTLNVCGDGALHEGVEACDTGLPYETDCDLSCRPITCGNGVVEPELGEVCDLGEDNHPLGDCLPNCLPARCGDGFVNHSSASEEECDEGPGPRGNREDGPCTPECRLARCGDGLLWVGGEGCDDGNAEAGDGCSEECVVEQDFCCIVVGEPCVGDGTPHPTKPCEWCKRSTSAASWSPRPAGDSCDDEDPCTLDDECDGAGNCSPGPDRTCISGNPCRVGRCYSDANPDNPCRFEDRDDGTTCDNGLFCDGHPDACWDGICEASSSAPCSDPTPVCDETSDECLECANNTHCPLSEPYCVDQECLECTADAQCPEDGSSCTTAYCTSSGECSQRGCSGGLVCTPDGCRECDNWRDCSPPWDCMGATCNNYSCNYHSNCPPGEVCFPDGCRPPG